jgi:hypothetical protein
MLLSTAWVFFITECAISIAAAFVFWHFWSQATIDRSVKLKAISVYAIGCLLCLALTLFLPL